MSIENILRHNMILLNTTIKDDGKGSLGNSPPYGDFCILTCRCCSAKYNSQNLSSVSKELNEFKNVEPDVYQYFQSNDEEEYFFNKYCHKDDCAREQVIEEIFKLNDEAAQRTLNIVELLNQTCFLKGKSEYYWEIKKTNTQSKFDFKTDVVYCLYKKSDDPSADNIFKGELRASLDEECWYFQPAIIRSINQERWLSDMLAVIFK